MMIDEIWLDIPITNHEYSVSNMGRVRSNDRIASDGRVIKGRILKPFKIKPRGYLGVALRIDGKTVKFLVHRLVYCTFNSIDINTPMDIDHYDNDPENNRLSNLSMLTRSENISKGYKMKRENPDYVIPTYECVNGGGNRKEVCQFSLDGKFIAEYESIVKAEEITGIGRHNISRALRGVFNHSGGYIWAYKSDLV